MGRVGRPDLKRVCSVCVGEKYLRQTIESEGKIAKCAYCSEREKVLTLRRVAPLVRMALETHFQRTPTEPSDFENAMASDDEMNYTWTRAGEPIEDVIQNYADVSEAIASDVRSVLQREYEEESTPEALAETDESPFSAEAHYETRSAADDADLWAEWNEFERTLKTRTRYFSRGAQETLGKVFSGIETHITSEGTSVIVTVGPESSIKSLYRARVFQSVDKLLSAMKRPDNEVGPPPSSVASAGRMNARGISVFYGAVDPEVAIAEVRPPVGSRVVMAPFKILQPLRLLDIKAFAVLDTDGSLFDPAYASKLAKASFLSGLSHRMSKAVLPDDEPFEYLTTQAVADFLGELNPPIHGLLYPSAQKDAGGNIVLFHKAARVKPLELPKGTKLAADLHNYGEEEEEYPDYQVYEVIPTDGHQDESRDEYPFVFERLYDVEQATDTRKPTLELEVSGVQVYHVEGVAYRTSSYNVRRHRMEQARREKPVVVDLGPDDIGI